MIDMEIGAGRDMKYVFDKVADKVDIYALKSVHKARDYYNSYKNKVPWLVENENDVLESYWVIEKAITKIEIEYKLIAEDVWFNPLKLDNWVEDVIEGRYTVDELVESMKRDWIDMCAYHELMEEYKTNV